MFFFLFLTSVFGLFLSTFFYFWIFLELNVISYVMYVVFYDDYDSSEPCMKYFLVQCLGSLLFLFSYFYICSFFHFSFGLLLVFFSLFLKLGMFPLHHWFPYISYYLNFDSVYILFTFQKLLSFFLIFFFGGGFLLLLFSLVGIIYSVLSQFSLSDFRVFMSFSSISHSGWMLIIGYISLFSFFFYYSFYSIILLLFFQFFFFNDITHTITIFFSNFFIFFYFMTFSGFPPTLGFYMKWCVLINIFFVYGSFVFLILFSFMVLSFLVYLRFYYYYYMGGFSSFMFDYNSTNFFFMFFIFFFPFF